MFQTMTYPTAVGGGATSQELQAKGSETERAGNTPIQESQQKPKDQVLLKRVTARTHR